MKWNEQKRSLTLAEDEIMTEQERKLPYKLSPIEVWQDLIDLDKTVEIEQQLRYVYENNLPKLGEIIFTSTCEFTCKHCIYSKEFGRFNASLGPEQWKRIIKNIYDELGIRTFILNGRSLDTNGVNVLKWIRESLHDVKIGIIDNGVSIIPYINDLYAIQPDWIDISIDGMEREHDIQRNRKGAFRKTLETIISLRDKEMAPKVNILSCLTTINKDSIIDLISFMNQEGFKNFFISPVSTFKDFGPSESLKVSGREWVNFIESVYDSLHELKDTWIEINIYDVEYVKSIKDLCPELWHDLEPDYDHIGWKSCRGDNEFYINYYPLSLNGTREFIVNCTGEVIFPQVIRKGRLTGEDVIGSLLSQSSSEVIRRLRDKKLEFFIKALVEEKNYLGGE